MVASLPWPCNMFYMWANLTPGLHVQYGWQHACWFSVPTGCMLSILSFLFPASVVFPLAVLVSPSPPSPCPHSLSCHSPLSGSLSRLSFLPPDSKITCNYFKKGGKKPNNSLQYLSLASCCPCLSQLAPYLRRPPSPVPPCLF